jgi:hypothetical protein
LRHASDVTRMQELPDRPGHEAVCIKNILIQYSMMHIAARGHLRDSL